jgi:hypothetical protein
MNDFEFANLKCVVWEQKLHERGSTGGSLEKMLKKTSKLGQKQLQRSNTKACER